MYFARFYYRVMLTSAPGTLVKKIKRKKFYIGINIIDVFE
jgi:hypothetical protein